MICLWKFVSIFFHLTILSSNFVNGVEDVDTTCANKHSFEKYLIYTGEEEVSPAMSIKFRSLIVKDITMWYDDGEDGVYQGILKFGQETTITSYPHHKFYFKYHQKRSKEIIAKVEITEKQVIYVISSSNTEEYTSGMKTILEDYKQKSQRELDFTTQYYKQTGRHWLHYFNSSSGKPRAPPRLNMWPAEKLGYIRQILSSELYWLCSQKDSEEKKNCRSSSLVPNENDTVTSSSSLAASAASAASSSYLSKLASLASPLFSTQPTLSDQPQLPLQLQTISLTPRAFLIENFLSPFEVNELIRLASPHISESVIGQADSGGIFKSNTRTSSNTWIKRSTSPIIESLYRRVGDVLGINHELLHHSSNAEDIQVVHYEVHEEYKPHYDWGVRGYPESRFITVLLYLSESQEENSGGETSFPKAGFKIVPKIGNAVIFYSLLEDGNGDINSLHASLPVRKGEKWLANFWVWDPLIAETVRESFASKKQRN